MPPVVLVARITEILSIVYLYHKSISFELKFIIAMGIPSVNIFSLFGLSRFYDYPSETS
jgi:hypothetical protein